MVFNGVAVHFGVVNGVYAAFLPIGVYAVEQEVDSVEVVQCVQEVNPAKRQQVAVGFFVGLVEVGYRESECYKVVVFVDNEIGKFKVDKGEVLFDVYVDLLFGERNEVVEY